MGSVVSRPKVATTVAASTSTSTSSATSSSTDTSATEADAEEVAKERVESVMRRSRSALGTVLTSLRGILSTNDSSVQRKSLLGE